MKGRIDSEGRLEIFRPRHNEKLDDMMDIDVEGDWVTMLCPWDTRAAKNDIVVNCGDHCPFFGEPENGVKAQILNMGSLQAPGAKPGQVPAKAVYGISLQTCRQHPLFFEEFSDNRI